MRFPWPRTDEQYRRWHLAIAFVLVGLIVSIAVYFAVVTDGQNRVLAEQSRLAGARATQATKANRALIGAVRRLTVAMDLSLSQHRVASRCHEHEVALALIAIEKALGIHTEIHDFELPPSITCVRDIPPPDNPFQSAEEQENG